MAANTLFSIHGITGQVFRGTLERGQSGVPILDERGAPAGFVSRGYFCAPSPPIRR